MNKIGSVLKRLRMLYGDSAKEFSSKLKISPSYLSEIENNKKSPSLKLLNNYSDVLGIKTSTIILIAEDKNSLKNESKIKQLIQPMMRKIILRGT